MAQTRPNDPTEPIFGEHPNERAAEPYIHSYGLTKREYFAAKALSAVAGDNPLTNREAVSRAVNLADELIGQLNQQRCIEVDASMASRQLSMLRGMMDGLAEGRDVRWDMITEHEKAALENLMHFLRDLLEGPSHPEHFPTRVTIELQASES